MHLKKWIPALLAFVILISGCLSAQSNNPDADTKILKGLKFYTALEPGLEIAKAQNKTAFIYFRSDSCGWCKKFEEETFTNQSVIKTLNEKFILVTIDVYDQKNETRNFRVRGTPTMVFIDPNDREIKRIPGYVETDIFLNTINGIAS